MTTTTATDYYALLGVDPDATTAQIKSAYRKLAKQYHPDVNNSPDAAEKFREITEAYDTLTDPDRRSLYDRLHGTGRTTSGDGERSRLHQARQRHPHRKRLQRRQPQLPQAASPILKVLEETWLEIRRWHPDIPPAVIIIASGTDSKHPRWGHHAPGRWNVNRQQLRRSHDQRRRTAPHPRGRPRHPAARSRPRPGPRPRHQGHLPPGPLPQQALQDLAEAVGLAVEHDQRNGWSATTITDVTEIAYAASSPTWPRP